MTPRARPWRLIPGLLLILSSGVSAQPADPPEPRASLEGLEGEQGLWVEERDDELQVAWLTEGSVPGLLRIRSPEGALLQEAETVPGQVHRVRFPRPPLATVVLEYGNRGGARHRTAVDLGGPRRPEARLREVDSLFVVGDVHGEYSTLVRLLENAGLLDDRGAWVGGRSHVVLLGDLFDRGDQVIRTLWLAYRLEREAAEAGGGFHVVLGNHETMVMTDDLRYVSRRELLVARLHGTSYDRLFDPRHAVLGRWLASRPGLMWVDGALLAHGGVTPEYGRYTVEAFNDSLATFLSEDFFYHLAAIFEPEDSSAALVVDPELADRARAERVVVMDSASAQRRLDFLFAESSVFWYRGYVQADTLEAALESVLDLHEAELHVVAHTPVETVQSRYGGRLVAVDLADPASEMVLLAREPGDRDTWTLWRYTLEGPPTPLPAGIGAKGQGSSRRR